MSSQVTGSAVRKMCGRLTAVVYYFRRRRTRIVGAS
jgi:hypothetical protein